MQAWGYSRVAARQQWGTGDAPYGRRQQETMQSAVGVDRTSSEIRRRRRPCPIARLDLQPSSLPIQVAVIGCADKVASVIWLLLSVSAL
jgi:hypothetical protein